MSTTTRRNGSTPKSSSSFPTTSQMTSSPLSTSSTSTTPSYGLTALLPSRRETLLLSLYPAILALGSLFSLLDPAARTAPYNPVTQSHPPSQAPAYFAKKSNILNLYFVKVAWFWITLAFFVFLFSSASKTTSTSIPGTATPTGTLTPKRLRAVGRWALVTLWWTFVTQWCFGPALIDRGFRLTGGICELALEAGIQGQGKGSKTEIFTGQACKSMGGSWRGGHDISGHVFILVLGSAFLILEILPVWAARWREEGQQQQESENEARDQDEQSEKSGRWPLLIVVGLSWWMLLMTAIYFHTWFEKVSPNLTPNMACMD